MSPRGSGLRAQSYLAATAEGGILRGAGQGAADMREALGGERRGQAVVMLALLGAANVAAWAWAIGAFRHQPALIGTALLAYSFGARHAVDADHIAAIDNVTRKLMQDGRRPLATGLYFSLGHSTVVVLAAIAIAASAAAATPELSTLGTLGRILGTALSALFLFAIAGANLFVLGAVYRSFSRVRAGGRYVDEHLDGLLERRGLLGRLFRPLVRLIGASWQMYPLGFLFALGFDTATEIGLLGITAAEASHGLPLWSILVFPALFTAGMSLIDTADGLLMLGAYGWAFAKPVRKLYYNLTVTFISVAVAVAVGGVEALGAAADMLGLEGRFWSAPAALNDHFAALGFLIIGIFAASWIVSLIIYRVKGYDALETTRG
jgi:nickel/cobalt transporter (NiCoT) family protein